MMDKKQLRKLCSEVRAAEAHKQKKDSLIAERILSCDRIINSDTVLLYASFGSEIDTAEIIDKLLTLGKKVALPRCEKGGKMTFHLISSMEQTSEGMYGITEPGNSLPIPVCTEKSAAVLPGLAFTENGERLGYGGGYYDRFLAESPFIYTIGLAYEDLIHKALPCQPHDLTVCAVATEERMVLCHE